MFRIILSIDSGMEWINYHHLRYFWATAREGSLAAAAARLRVSQPSISEQIRDLEATLGEKLFRKEGRKNRLTEAGHVVFGYAEEIFALGQEMLSSIKQRPGARSLRLNVGIVDSLPKHVSNDILAPAFSSPRPVHMVCREGKLEDLLAQLAAHRLDLVLADEPAPSSANLKLFTHPLGESGATFCAAPALARKLRRGFPKSLHNAPALLPSESSTFRRSLEAWFRHVQVQPRLLAEFDDLALMKVMAVQPRGFIAVPTIGLRDATEHYGFQPIGQAKGCKLQFFALTSERRLIHPVVAEITRRARTLLRSQ